MSNYQRTANWLKACGKEPTPENLSLQIGCHLEEFCEFIGTLRSDSEGYGKLLERTKADLEWYAVKLKKREQFVYIPTHLRTDALDALCDAEVTGNGVAYMAGFNKPEADLAVLENFFRGMCGRYGEFRLADPDDAVTTTLWAGFGEREFGETEFGATEYGKCRFDQDQMTVVHVAPNYNRTSLRIVQTN